MGAAPRGPAGVRPHLLDEQLALLRRSWLETAAEVVPASADLAALVGERLDALRGDVTPSEHDLLSIAEEAAQVSLRSASADGARALSKRMRRAVYEFLLAVDAAAASADKAVVRMEPAPPLQRPLAPGAVLIGLEEVAGPVGRERPELRWDVDGVRAGSEDDPAAPAAGPSGASRDAGDLAALFAAAPPPPVGALSAGAAPPPPIRPPADAAVAIPGGEAAEATVALPPYSVVPGDPDPVPAGPPAERPTLTVVDLGGPAAPSPSDATDAAASPPGRAPGPRRDDGGAAPLVVPSYRAWADVLASSDDAVDDLDARTAGAVARMRGGAERGDEAADLRDAPAAPSEDVAWPLAVDTEEAAPLEAGEPDATAMPEDGSGVDEDAAAEGAAAAPVTVAPALSTVAAGGSWRVVRDLSAERSQEATDWFLPVGTGAAPDAASEHAGEPHDGDAPGDVPVEGDLPEAAAEPPPAPSMSLPAGDALETGSDATATAPPAGAAAEDREDGAAWEPGDLEALHDEGAVAEEREDVPAWEPGDLEALHDEAPWAPIDGGEDLLAPAQEEMPLEPAAFDDDHAAGSGDADPGDGWPPLPAVAPEPGWPAEADEVAAQGPPAPPEAADLSAPPDGALDAVQWAPPPPPAAAPVVAPPPAPDDALPPDPWAPGAATPRSAHPGVAWPSPPAPSRTAAWSESAEEMPAVDWPDQGSPAPAGPPDASMPDAAAAEGAGPVPVSPPGEPSETTGEQVGGAMAPAGEPDADHDDPSAPWGVAPPLPIPGPARTGAAGAQWAGAAPVGFGRSADLAGSWQIRQSPRQQVLAERMAERRREEALRAADSVVEPDGRRRRRGDREPGRLERASVPVEVDDLLRRKRGSEAAALLQRAAQELGGREISDLALDAGDRCKGLGQTRAAINAFLAAWRADPLYEAPLWRLADTCLGERSVELAVGYLERIADLMRARGDDEGAAGVYRKIVTVAPDRVDVRDVMRAYQTSGHFPD